MSELWGIWSGWSSDFLKLENITHFQGPATMPVLFVSEADAKQFIQDFDEYEYSPTKIKNFTLEARPFEAAPLMMHVDDSQVEVRPLSGEAAEMMYEKDQF